jgi:hypothetical protein
MTEESKRFLNFNGTNINVVTKDEQKWIALKPICEKLNLNWEREFKRINDDPILGKNAVVQWQIGPDGKLSAMTCLPELYVYGWVISICSKSEELQVYKQECFDALFNHFRNSVR